MASSDRGVNTKKTVNLNGAQKLELIEKLQGISVEVFVILMV